MSNSGSDIDLLFEEWKQTRDVLKTFDDRIHDLRKYGFTFITGLLTIQGFLLPWIPATGQQSATGLPDPVKFGILVATTLLIVVLRWFDGNYQGFQYGAAIRSIVIERFLNLELSDEISARYDVEKLWLPKIILYGGFQGAVIGLSLALLPSHVDWIVYLTLGAVAESVAYYLLVSPQRLARIDQGTDWAIDRLSCTRGQHVRLMVTNLHRKTRFRFAKEKHLRVKDDGYLELKHGQIIWRILKEDGQPIHECKMAATVMIKPMGSHVWEWPVNVEPGIYRIEVNFGDTNVRELARKLYVTEKIPGQKTLEHE